MIGDEKYIEELKKHIEEQTWFTGARFDELKDTLTKVALKRTVNAAAHKLLTKNDKERVVTASIKDAEELGYECFKVRITDSYPVYEGAIPPNDDVMCLFEHGIIVYVRKMVL
jgi:translation initiation factor 2B subunit (eIF-2B alpha/beta/delta family)